LFPSFHLAGSFHTGQLHASARSRDQTSSGVACLASRPDPTTRIDTNADCVNKVRTKDIGQFQLAHLSVREEKRKRTVPAVYCMQLELGDTPEHPHPKFHHFVPVLLHETHPYYNRPPPAEHSTTAVSQQASPARSGASRPLCLPVLGNVEALNLARDVIYRNLHLPVCICRLLLFAASWAQLPDSDGAIFRP